MASPGAIDVHAPSQCKGAPCPFHAPSAHHMVDWPLNVRHDKSCLAERICPHGVGHPDPDSLAWLRRGGIGRHELAMVTVGRLDGNVEVLVEDAGPAPLMEPDDADAHSVHGCCAERCCAA